MLTPPVQSPYRLLSLDVMRGLIMILLAGEASRLYSSMNNLEIPGAVGFLIQQFFHHPWNGLRFWDLVQPAFMLMAGSAMYISYFSKEKKGISWRDNLPHIIMRCVKLFIFGTALHCIYAGKLVWELWNVLTQLSVTTLIAYLIIRKSYTFQILFSIVLLVLTELVYRYTAIPGFDQPFVIDKNFGSYMDTIFMGKINGDGWVTINFIPTAAHTIWGVLAGKLLVSEKTWQQKLRILTVYGLGGVIAGYVLDYGSVTPIIKRISTSSFTLVSGGWVLLILAFLYWLTDIKKVNRHAWIFVVVGMNAIFIYMFFETVGAHWLNDTVGIFVKGFTGQLGAGEKAQAVFTAIVTLFFEWYLCYWLWKNKIFFKL